MHFKETRRLCRRGDAVGPRGCRRWPPARNRAAGDPGPHGRGHLHARPRHRDAGGPCVPRGPPDGDARCRPPARRRRGGPWAAGRVGPPCRRGPCVPAGAAAQPRCPAAQASSRLREISGTRFVEATVAPGSPVSGRLVREVEWPPRTLLTGIARGGALVMPNGATRLQPGDGSWVWSIPRTPRNCAR